MADPKEQEVKKRRLAAALRDNLKRRKAQERERTSDKHASSAPDNPATTEDA